MKLHPNFSHAIQAADRLMRDSSHTVKPDRWQGIDVSAKPEATMKEVLNHSFQVSLGWKEDIPYFAQDIQPNLPWADRHFEEERVSGYPINPGETWKIWPYGNSADKFRDSNGGQFNHTYAERYWPKLAGGGKGSRFGIRYRYADLDDLIHELGTDPLTRQAYLPVWFPEDGSHHDRKPCTLGYHFIMRGGYFHCTYYIRSCDFMRHFRDDIYLTLRLQLWILQKLRERSPEPWQSVRTGLFTMHIVSLHLFINDWNKLYGSKA